MNQSSEILIEYGRKEQGRDRLPVFTLSLASSGEVNFNGLKYTAVVGQCTKTIPATNVLALAERLQKEGFFGWDDGAGKPMVHGSMVRYISMAKCGLYHKISFGFHPPEIGSSNFPLQKILFAEADILTTAGIDEWVRGTGFACY
jgi:hypothetical protein